MLSAGGGLQVISKEKSYHGLFGFCSKVSHLVSNNNNGLLGSVWLQKTLTTSNRSKEQGEPATSLQMNLLSLDNNRLKSKTSTG